MRHSIVMLGADDVTNLNETANDMLYAILQGLNLELDWCLVFEFVESKLGFSAQAVFYEMPFKGSRIKTIEPFYFGFRAPDGLGAYKSLELLRTNVDMLCTAMTQGRVYNDWGGLAAHAGNKWSTMFIKRADHDVTRHHARTIAAS